MVTKPQTAARQPSLPTTRSFRSKDSAPTTILAVEAAAPNLLAQLSEAARQALLALGRRRDYAAGDLLYRQGDHHNGVYLIEEGLIRSYYHSEDGRELTLGYWAVGHFVGAPQMFGGGRHTWTSVAVVDAHCLWLPGAELRSLALQWPELALALVDALAYKSQCYCALLQLLATQSMQVRLARLLVMFAARDEPLPTKLSHGEMASMIGSTRQWVSQTLARFAEEGLIAKANDGAIHVVRAEQLAALR